MTIFRVIAAAIAATAVLSGPDGLKSLWAQPMDYLESGDNRGRSSETYAEAYADAYTEAWKDYYRNRASRPASPALSYGEPYADEYVPAIRPWVYDFDDDGYWRDDYYGFLGHERGIDGDWFGGRNYKWGYYDYDAGYLEGAYQEGDPYSDDLEPSRLYPFLESPRGGDAYDVGEYRDSYDREPYDGPYERLPFDLDEFRRRRDRSPRTQRLNDSYGLPPTPRAYR